MEGMRERHRDELTMSENQREAITFQRDQAARELEQARRDAEHARTLGQQQEETAIKMYHDKQVVSSELHSQMEANQRLKDIDDYPRDWKNQELNVVMGKYEALQERATGLELEDAARRNAVPRLESELESVNHKLQQEA